MHYKNIPLKDIGFASHTVIDYLEGKEELKPFYNYPPKISSFKEAITAKATSYPAEYRTVLVNALKRQYGTLEDGLAADSPVFKNIEALNDNNTFTVTAGQQIHVFLGPLFVLYKIVHAINLAKAAEEVNPGKKIVPVFWMATEDHDFDEVNHFKLFGEKYVWDDVTAGGPVGRLNPESLSRIIGLLNEKLKAPEASELLDIFKTAYTTYKTFADATRYIVHHLFGEYGLVVIDPDDKELKKLFIPYTERDLLEQKNAEHLAKCSAELKAAGFETQIKSKGINTFYITDSSRERFEVKGDKFVLPDSGKTFTKDELLKELNNHPERFSPNVVLRPLYQEVILPNLAYIAGGSELKYWFQLKQVFAYNKITFPIVSLRKSAVILGNKVIKLIDESGLKVEEYFLEEEQFLKNLLAKMDNTYTLTPERAAIEASLEVIIEKVKATNAPMLKEIASDIKDFKKFLIKVEAQQKESAIELNNKQIDKINKIRINNFLTNSPQERTESGFAYLVRGYKDFVEILLKNIDTESTEISVLNS